VVKWDDSDLELITDIFDRLKEFSEECLQIRFSCPRPSAWKIRSGSHILHNKDGLMIVYGKVSSDWVHEQYEQAVAVIPQEREKSFAAVGIYDGPPAEKDAIFLHDPPILHILNCRTSFDKEAIRRFVEALQTGGAVC
jgi:hypothetical protein